MSVTELKLRIINKITTIEDELILEEIFRLVDLESEMDSVYRLTDDEGQAVDQGLRDIKVGRVYSSDAADKMNKEWLKSQSGHTPLFGTGLAEKKYGMVYKPVTD